MRPITDLKGSRTDPVVQAAPTRDCPVEKDAHHSITASQPITLPILDQRPTFPDRQRFVGDPRHPRPKMLDALCDRFTEDLSVLSQPPAQHDPTGARDQFWKTIGHTGTVGDLRLLRPQIAEPLCGGPLQQGFCFVASAGPSARLLLFLVMDPKRKHRVDRPLASPAPGGA